MPPRVNQDSLPLERLSPTAEAEQVARILHTAGTLGRIHFQGLQARAVELGTFVDYFILLSGFGVAGVSDCQCRVQDPG